MEDLDTELLGQLQRWHEEDQYQRIIDAIEAIPQPERGYELTCQLARAYNNLAGPEEAGPLEKSVSLLESIADQGQEDPLWHYRLGYALFYLDREEEALPHFQRAAELDPQDPDAAEFIRQCQKYIAAKQCCPEVYGQEDWDTVDQHIHTYFGSSENVFHEIVSPDIHVDIYIIPPSPERNYYVLMTHGMGAHAMNVPEDLAGQKLERAELFICLPPDWKVGEEGEAWYWPIRWLKILARLPINEDSWLGWGHTIANPDGSPFAENTRFNGIMLVNPGAFPQKASVCPLSGGDEVNFYQLLPLYQEEMDFKLSHSAGELLDLFPEEDLETVDVDRPSVLSDRPQKEFAIPQQELRHLYDGEGPQGCFATDRILVDGCRVGYCYREEPEEGDENWDSGWRFTAGDESDSYMDDPGRSGIYHLNTLCNYDPDIIPLLDSEPGTAWCRDQSGVFRPELYQPDEE